MQKLSRVVLAAILGVTAFPTFSFAQSIELNLGAPGVRFRPPPEERTIVRRRVIEEDDDADVTVRRRRVCELHSERIWDDDLERYVVRRTRICRD